MITPVNPTGLWRGLQYQLDCDKWPRTMDVIFEGVFDIHEDTIDISVPIEEIIYLETL